MESFLQIEDLTKSVGDRILFHNITFGVNEGDKIGIIAPNGTGKTTLLNCINGSEDYDSGQITFRNDLRVAMLPQIPHLDPDKTVLEACIQGSDSEIANIISQYTHAVNNGHNDTIAALSHTMDRLDAWDYQDRLIQLLDQLNIPDTSQLISTLSGGQQKRVAIARLILEQPQLIILDEPTNHLDIATIEWLESWLTRQRVTLIMVTHDRYFLDRVCNRIIEIDQQQIFSYDSGYDNFIRRRAERIDALNQQLDRLRNTLRRETQWVQRQPQARAGKARFRLDAYDKLKQQTQQLAKTQRTDNINLDDINAKYIGSKILEARNISKQFDGHTVIRDFTYTFARGEKIGIIGPNGAGKTTLIRILQQLIRPDSGTLELGTTVRFGYYSQHGLSLPADKRIIDAITDITEDITLNDSDRHYTPTQFLQRFNFTPKDQQKFIATLSGGEKARLHLAVTLIHQPNFLILDEPTNDLDIPTLLILEQYLRQYNGCAIIITHDRYFLDNVADHLLIFQPDATLRDYPGTYTEYRKARQENDRKTTPAPKSTATNDSPANNRVNNRKPKLTFAQRNELQQLTAELESLNNELQQIEQLFAAPDTAPDALTAASVRYPQLKQLIDDKELRWLELSELE